MKTLLRIEEAFLFGLAVYLYSTLKLPWWLFFALLLVPDVSMLGYTVNTRIGAIIYNIFHHRAFSISLFVVGAIANVEVLQLIGVIIFAHTNLDRVFEYGLKYADQFQHTHLGSGDQAANAAAE